MESRQKIMKQIGDTGCYFLCIVNMAERITGKRIDAVEHYLAAVNNKLMQENCFVMYPDKIMEQMTGTRWYVRKENHWYNVKPSELEVQRYERQVINSLQAHFILPDYDPLGTSLTVAQGKLASKRIFKPL